MCPTLAGGFLTTVPPGKSLYSSVNYIYHVVLRRLHLLPAFILVKRVNPKSSHRKKKYLFSISLIMYLYEMMDGH